MIDIESLWHTILSVKKLLTLSNIWKKLIYFYNYYFSSPFRVVIFGCSGTGKSQFVKTITEEIDYNTSRTRIPQKERIILENGKKIEFIDTPGHQTLDQARRDLCLEFKKKKIKGIFNIVNYGYNEVDNISSELSVFRAGTYEVKQEFLKDNRKLEINQLSEWMSFVTSDTKIKWVVTIINKADIWYENREMVMKYYEEGDYFNKIMSLRSCCHFYKFEFCSIINPFFNKPMQIVFGDREKKKLFDCFKDNLMKLV